MGGIVSTMMEQWSAQSFIEHPIVSAYQNYGLESAPVPGTKNHPGEGPVYRFRTVSDEEQSQIYQSTYHGQNWLQVLQSKSKKIPDQPAIAYRDLERIETRSIKASQPGKPNMLAQYYYLSDRKMITYGEMWDLMACFALGLRALQVEENSTACMYEETRWEWLISIYGIWLNHCLVSTVYSNLGEDALQHALVESAASVIITNGSKLSILSNIIEKNHFNPQPLLIYLDERPPETSGKILCRSYPWKEVVELGKKLYFPAPEPPLSAGEPSVENAQPRKAEHLLYIPQDNDETALIMYTSGTTGDPKGVVHTHGSLAAGFLCLNHRFTDLYPTATKKSFYLAYLPLAHILEFGVVSFTLYNEMMVGFGTPRTLTDTYAIPHGDLKEFEPNFLVGVPRIYDTIKKAIEAKLPPHGTIKRAVFTRAYQSRRDALRQGKDTPFWNEHVFAAAKAVLGDNMQGMLSGGGPLSLSTQEFIDVVCGGPLVLQGWGMTETVCVGATQRLGDLDPFIVGQPLHGVELKLVDTEEYKHTDKPEPRGELCIRGPFLFKGYYKQPEMTKEAIDADGWFHTGDVGSITPEGRIKIVGRIKALAKNCLGEYIAMEALEALYAQNELCAVNGVCVLVHPNKNFITALVLPDSEKAIQFAKKHGLKPATYPELLTNQKFHDLAAESLAETAKHNNRLPFEVVKRVKVLADEWTPENGLVTPTAKLRRTKIMEHYASLIEELFA